MALLLLEETITQLLFVILVSPLFAGIMAKFKSRVESRKGQSIFQPYYDIAKYMRKETLIPAGSSGLFLYLPYISFGVYCLIALIIPVLIPAPIYFTASADFLGGAILFTLAGFLKMVAAIDTRNNFSAMGVSRIMSFTFLGEGTLITVFFAVSLITGTNNPYVTSA
ncbi:MAG: NADH-quinone oxidoreductase subunit H, partial [Candidatus Thermoplasmatota archaeon]|nr:NADH-quinone oxidoreductase subunit H [Candidatus Thermoplasmatota archaeon]